MPDKDAPKKQTISEKTNGRAKEVGFKNLAELVEISEVSRQTLNNWYNHKRTRFELIMKGAMIKKMETKPNGKRESK